MLFIPEMYKDAKRFAKRHKTVIACAATASVAVVATRKIDTRIARDFAYEAGRENGVLSLQNVLLRDFVDHRGLRDEFFDHVKDMAGDKIEYVEQVVL